MFTEKRCVRSTVVFIKSALCSYLPRYSGNFVPISKVSSPDVIRRVTMGELFDQLHTIEVFFFIITINDSNLAFLENYVLMKKSIVLFFFYGHLCTEAT